VALLWKMICNYCDVSGEPFKHRTLSEEETDDMGYGVATISRLLKMIGLFCKRALSKRLMIQGGEDS